MSEVKRKNMRCSQGSLLLTGALLLGVMNIHAERVKSLSLEKKIL